MTGAPATGLLIITYGEVTSNLRVQTLADYFQEADDDEWESEPE